MSFSDSFTADADSPNQFQATGSIRVHAEGTFGGGTLTLQEFQPDETWDDVDGSAKQQDGDYIFDVLSLSTFRFSLTGSTTPTISVVVKGAIVKPA